jgi:hypothetical protein
MIEWTYLKTLCNTFPPVRKQYKVEIHATLFRSRKAVLFNHDCFITFPAAERFSKKSPTRSLQHVVKSYWKVFSRVTYSASCVVHVTTEEGNTGGISFQGGVISE